METLFSILGFASLAHLMAEYATHQQLPLPEKPFKCNLCLAFWLSLLPFFILQGAAGILTAAITGITSEIIYKLINRL